MLNLLWQGDPYCTGISGERNHNLRSVVNSGAEGSHELKSNTLNLISRTYDKNACPLFGLRAQLDKLKKFAIRNKAALCGLLVANREKDWLSPIWFGIEHHQRTARGDGL